MVPVMISNDSVSSTTLTNCSRFILHPRARSLRVAFVPIVIFFFAVVFLFFFILVGLFPQENIGCIPSNDGLDAGL